jgi:hypothetical protein
MKLGLSLGPHQVVLATRTGIGLFFVSCIGLLGLGQRMINK